MALDRTKIIKAVKNRIYQQGVGEKPSIREATGTATVTGDKVTFSLAAGEGAKCRSGQILSSYNADADEEYGFYVLSLSTDAVTAVNGYEGEAIANSATMPVLLEHQAEVTEYQIASAIDDVIASYLFPEVFDIILDSFTPNLASLQTNADTLDEAIIRAWQKIGPTVYQVPIKLVQNMPTGDFAAGKMLVYDAVTTTTVNYSAKRKVSLTTSSDTALEGLIAKGAAALVIEGVEQAPSDVEEKGPDSRALWGSFYNAKRQFETAIAKEAVTAFKVDRG